MSHGSTGFVHSPENKETQDMAGLEIVSFPRSFAMHEGLGTRLLVVWRLRMLASFPGSSALEQEIEF